MMIKKRNIKLTSPKEKVKSKGDSLRSFAAVTACAVLAVAISGGSMILEPDGRSQVYAASDSENAAELTAQDEAWMDGDTLPSGIAGVVSGVSETPVPGSTIKRIGTSCEDVMVGQRVKTVSGTAAEFNVSSSLENRINALDSKVTSLAENPKIMSDADYNTLLRIVEAEAGTEDIKGRVLVANVIMNRVKHEEFPDTVTEVVWESVNGVPQFSPTYDGRISEVTVSDDTREAVKQALEGTDYSEGALFFIQKSAAEKHNVTWFEKDLKKLFKHGVHEFYTYPEEETGQADEEKKTDGDLVRMAKR